MKHQHLFGKVHKNKKLLKMVWSYYQAAKVKVTKHNLIWKVLSMSTYVQLKVKMFTHRQMDREVDIIT